MVIDTFFNLPLFQCPIRSFCLPFQVEVALSGTGIKSEGAESGTNGEKTKALPPWMIKQNMNLTKEQRGETSSSSNLNENSEASDDKKQDSKEDEKSIQDEYIKAYYEALRKRQEEEDAKRRLQHEGETFASASHSERQVGMKAKREDEDEGVEWEEEQPTAETYKLADLNVEAQESGDEEDDIDWEEG
ncbi:hypothetical protein GUJ93_ZPchr0008g12788 [Zizania palustris]|uniref:Uncharacterized protein n=1 Tax=Zizania palustris TaxID=103762 RepID=A0A8J5RCQ7_ZIZPA|nr:hypothetical protein GUJ93_ZPchr0008g12788 [Zizania palustris]